MHVVLMWMLSKLQPQMLTRFVRLCLCLCLFVLPSITVCLRPPHSFVTLSYQHRSLGFALRRLSHDQLVIDPVQISQYVTLLFIGTISALSIRAFLRNASLFFSTLTQFRGRLGFSGSSLNPGAAAAGGGKGFAGGGGGRGVPGGGGGASLVLMLSELTGVYSISSLLLIRRNVPVKYRDVIDNVLGGQLEFQYFHRWVVCGGGGGGERACVCQITGWLYLCF